MPIEEEDVESCGSRPSPTHSSSHANPRHHRHKFQVYSEVLRRIQDSDFREANLPGFDHQLWLHFNRLPARYALDVNVDRAEDVLTHKRLLQLAVDPANRPAFEVRSVQVYPSSNENYINSSCLDSSMIEDAQSSFNYSNIQGNHPPPTFGSSPHLEALALQASKYGVEDGDSALHVTPCFSRPMHEITFATSDKPKLLSQETEELKRALEKEILNFKEQCWSEKQSSSALGKNNQNRVESFPSCVEIPADGTDVWEIDTRQLKLENKVGSGSYGDLYRGTYFSQEVAIKVLRPELINEEMIKEFSQEVYIMRKVRHKNVVQFIGACTRPSNLCIVTEFMSRGSIFDFLHKQRGVFNLPSLLKVAIDISRGMNYLHQNNIIHRDLKTANLLMDENMVVKVADFGVARVQTQSGVMTAETGTYRWMAPEVIEHKPYDHKADVFSFGIALWELLTGEIPYSSMTPLQAAVGVVQKGLRPTIPKNVHPILVELLEKCWRLDPTERPDFSEIIEILKQMAEQIENNGEDRRKKDKLSGGFFSAFRKGHR